MSKHTYSGKTKSNIIRYTNRNKNIYKKYSLTGTLDGNFALIPATSSLLLAKNKQQKLEMALKPIFYIIFPIKNLTKR